MVANKWNIEFPSGSNPTCLPPIPDPSELHDPWTIDTIWDRKPIGFDVNGLDETPFVPIVFGLIILLCISIIHFGQSDLSYLKHANVGLKFAWGFVMTLLPVIFFESDVKSIFDTLVNIDIDTRIFVFLRKITILFILSFLFFLYRSYAIAKKDKFFLGLEFLITLVLANFLPPLYWFTFYFCFLHGIRALINIGINSSRDFLFLIIFTLPVTFFSYFILLKNLNFEYLNVIFSVLMSLTISHMLLPLLNRLLSRGLN